MAYFLLILLTAIYLIRPADWIPILSSIPLFQLAILPCLVLSMDTWTKRLNAQSLNKHPIDLCVVGLLVTACLSQLLNAPGEILTTFGFSKACIFYLLIVSIVNSENKLRNYLVALALIIFVLAMLMIIGQHGTIIARKADRAEALGGQNFDPNDTAAILIIGILICAHFVLVSPGIIRRIFWAVPAIVTANGLKLTDSRGGFFALCIGVVAYVGARWGRKGLALGLCLLPPLALTVATNRMADTGAVSEGTGQARVQLWHSGFALLTHNPLLGVGPDQFTNVVGKASHNSFVQSYAELGFLGGTFFVGAFYFAASTMFRRVKQSIDNPQNVRDAEHASALSFGIIAGYSVAIFALNHLYSAGTYMVLALATSANSTSHEFLEASDDRMQDFTKNIIVVSVSFLIFIYVAANVLVNW